MIKKQNILSFILLGTYLLVLLHNVVPHFHGESDCVSEEAIHHQTSHHHHEGQDHHHDSDENILHALGHIFNGFHHLDMSEEQLTHVITQANNFENSFFLDVVSANNGFVLTQNIIVLHEHRDYSAYAAPPLGQALNSALPLRAPPINA